MIEKTFERSILQYSPKLGTNYICISTFHLNPFLDHLCSMKFSSEINKLVKECLFHFRKLNQELKYIDCKPCNIVWIKCNVSSKPHDEVYSRKGPAALLVSLKEARGNGASPRQTPLSSESCGSKVSN